MIVLRYILIILAGLLMAAIIIKIGENFLKEISRFIEEAEQKKEKNHE